MNAHTRSGQNIAPATSGAFGARCRKNRNAPKIRISDARVRRAAFMAARRERFLAGIQISEGAHSVRANMTTAAGAADARGTMSGKGRVCGHMMRVRDRHRLARPHRGHADFLFLCRGH